METFEKDGTLSELFVSFSRDVDKPDKEIRYVQHNIRKHSKRFVKKLFEENATLYVCGDAKNMAKDVNDTLNEVVAEELEISVDEAKKRITSLMIDRRYLQDIWT